MAMFTKKHYKEIAKVFNDYHACHGESVAADDVMYRLVLMFREDNEQFSQDRFVEACKQNG